MTETAPYRIPREPGRWRSLLLAALVHLMLVGFLWFGIRWQNQTPVAVEAEVWDTQVKEAAPAPAPTPPPPVETKPVPPAPVPKPVEPARVITPPAPKPDIALEQEKKRKQAAEKLAEQKRQEKVAEQKRLAEQQKRQQAEKQAEAEAAKRRKQEEDQRKLAAEKQKQKQREAAETRAAEARHQENLKRMQAQAGGSGDAPKSQGPRSTDPSYVQRVGAKIKSNTVFSVPQALAGNPPVEYDVQLLPDGSLRGLRKLRSSGVAGFDEAVARAIERSQPYPPDRSGAVPGGFTLSHRPKDQ